MAALPLSVSLIVSKRIFGGLLPVSNLATGFRASAHDDVRLALRTRDLHSNAVAADAAGSSPFASPAQATQGNAAWPATQPANAGGPSPLSQSHAQEVPRIVSSLQFAKAPSSAVSEVGRSIITQATAAPQAQQIHSQAPASAVSEMGRSIIAQTASVATVQCTSAAAVNDSALWNNSAQAAAPASAISEMGRSIIAQAAAAAPTQQSPASPVARRRSVTNRNVNFLVMDSRAGMKSEAAGPASMMNHVDHWDSSAAVVAGLQSKGPAAFKSSKGVFLVDEDDNVCAY